MTRRARFAAGGPALWHPKEPLRLPFMLYDTREWNGMTDGSSILHNMGSSGSAFDLPVTEFAFGINTMASASVNVTGDGAWAWSDGPPCDGPYTMMTVMRYGGRTGGPVANGVPQMYRALVGFGGGAGGQPTFSHTCEIGFRGQSAGFASGDMFINFGAGGGATAPQALQNSSFAGSRQGIVTYDPVDGGSTGWLGTTALNPSGATFTRTGGVGSCASVPSAVGINVEAVIAAPFARVLWPPDGMEVIGLAVFRGEPTTADITFWTTYFTGASPFTHPFAYSLGGYFGTSENFGLRHSWYDATHCYHWLAYQPSSTLSTFGEVDIVPIPGASMPSTIDFILVGAGENAATSAGVGNGRGGGGGAGQVVQVSGHTAPTTTSPFTVGGFAREGYVDFEGFHAAGVPDGNSFPFRTNGGNGWIGNPFTGGTGLSGTAGGGGAGAAGNGGNRSGTTAGNGGIGIGPGASWHWTNTAYYHGVGGYGQGAPDGVYGNTPLGLGAGAIGAVVNGAGGVQSGGPAGLIFRYAY